MKKQVDVILDFLINDHRNLLLMGGGGTGKSTLIRKWLAVDESVISIAPTGIASINLGMGCATAHATCGIPISPNLYDHIEKGLYPRISMAKRDTIKECTALLIDEISMIRSDVLDFIDYVFRRVRHTDYPFGGARLVLVGDPFQLPPVVKAGDGLKKAWFFESNVYRELTEGRKSLMKKAELTEVHRQEDKMFSGVLSRIRTGDFSDDDIDYINQCVTPWDQDCIVLASTNSVVESINNYKLDELTTESFTNQMEVFGKFNPKDVRAPELLELKIGARVVFVKNKYSSEGKVMWVNGTTGKVDSFEGDMIRVVLENDDVVDVGKESWEKIERTFSNDKWSQDMVGSCLQYPLRLGFASTIHSAQSLTLSNFFFKNENLFSTGQLYTAISRATGPEALKLEQKIDKRDIRIDPKVKSWYGVVGK